MTGNRLIFAVIPVKALSESKSRLSKLLQTSDRSLLTVAMMKDVLNAVAKSKIISKKIIISPDTKVLKIAEGLKAHGILQMESGLNNAVNQAANWCLENGGDSILVLPSDIPLVNNGDIKQIAALGSEKRIVVISPSLDGGTNAMFQHPIGVIPPCFGPDSFRKHLNSALSRGIAVKVYRSPRVSLDIDSLEDLREFVKNPSGTSTYKLLRRIGFA